MDGDGRIFRNGGLLVEDGTIEEVGRSDDVKKRAGRVEMVLGGPHLLVIPGLINTHVHPAQALLRGLVPDDLRLVEWLRDWVWPLQGNFEGEDGVVAAELAALEMLRSGTTTFLATSMHSRYDIEGSIRVFHSSGLRAAIGRQTMDMPDYAMEKGILYPGMIEEREESLASFKRLYSTWNGKDDRVWIWLSPRTPGAVSDDLYREVAELRREYDTGVTMHLAEIGEDLEYFRSRRTTPARFLEELGLTGAKGVFVHCVQFEDEDIAIFARTHTSVSHNPSSNMKLASGIAPISMMLAAGVNVTLGTDGGPSNDSYDMVREMRTAALLQKVGTGDPSSLRVMDVMRMATINGARALGIDDIVGSLERGKRADLVVLNLRRPHLVPSIFGPSNLVYSATGQDVEYVFVDGVPMVEGGLVRTLDEERVLEEAEEHAERLYSRVKGEPWLKYLDQPTSTRLHDLPEHHGSIAPPL